MLSSNPYFCKSYRKHDASQTSINAFIELEDTNLRQIQYGKIMLALQQNGNLNNSEIATITGIKISNVTPRIYELRGKDGRHRMKPVIECKGTKKDRVTKKKTQVWGLI